MTNPFENIHYDAFISYRHNPKDEYVAKNLQLLLETYIVPENVKDVVEKERITRIFRDQDELPLSDSLGTSIENALRNSEYLIVICSPTYRESKWCMKEIETFISLNGYGKIIVVLSEGTTESAFPPQLLSAESEPFASDVRGTSNREIMKKLRVEYVRVAASLLGVPYDTLRQREQERMLQRKTRNMRNIAILTGTVAILSFAALTTISVQKKQLEINNIESYLSDAIEEYSLGNITASKEDIIKASKYNKGLKHSYDGAIQNKLTKILGVYDTKTEYKPIDTYQMGGEIVNVRFSDDGKHILLADKVGNVRVISSDNFGSEEFSTGNARSGVKDSFSATFIDNDTLCFVNDNEYKLLEVNLNDTSKITTKALLGSRKNENLVISPDGKYLAVVVDTEVAIIDNESKKIVYSDKYKRDDEKLSYNSYITFLDDEKILYSVSDENSDTEYEKESRGKEIVTIYDINTDEYWNYSTGVCKTVYATLIDDRLYLCSKTLSLQSDKQAVVLNCIDYESGEPLWSTGLGYEGVESIHKTKNGKLLVAASSVIKELNMATGSLMDVYDIENAKVMSFENVSNDTVKIFTSLGQEINIDVSTDKIVLGETKELMDTTSYKMILKSKNSDVIYAIPNGDPSIISKYEMSKLPTSEAYDGTVDDYIYSDSMEKGYSVGPMIAAYGTPYAKLNLVDQIFSLYSFENGRVIIADKADRDIIDQEMLDFKVEVEAGEDAYGNLYYAEKVDENHYGGAIAVSKEGVIISVFDNFGGLTEDGKKVILNTQTTVNSERELRAYPIYSYKELLKMVQ